MMVVKIDYVKNFQFLSTPKNLIVRILGVQKSKHTQGLFDDICIWGKGKRESSYACREEEGCVGVCLTKAPYRNDKIEIVEELCTDCRACVDRCDLGALIIK